MLSDLIDDCARSLGFLSRLPMPGRFFEGHDGQMSRTIRAFPLAGLIIALPTALLLLVAGHLHADPTVTAILAIALQTALTGALHEDGWADTLDGLGGGRNREAALAIMKDSRIGTYGALGLILAISLKIAGLVALLVVLEPPQVACAWIGIAMASRTGIVWHWDSLPPARKDGVAASVGLPERSAALFAYVTGLISALVLLWLAIGLAKAIASLAAAAFVLALATRWIGRKIDGHTGDTIGFCQQAVEITLLAALALFL